MKPRRVKVPPRLWFAIGAVESAGQQLSNIAFNLHQDASNVITENDKTSMRECQQKWDKAQRALSQLLR